MVTRDIYNLIATRLTSENDEVFKRMKSKPRDREKKLGIAHKLGNVELYSTDRKTITWWLDNMPCIQFNSIMHSIEFECHSKTITNPREFIGRNVDKNPMLRGLEWIVFNYNRFCSPESKDAFRQALAKQLDIPLELTKVTTNRFGTTGIHVCLVTDWLIWL